MKKEYWTTITVSKSTKAALERARESMLVGDDKAVLPLDSKDCRSGEDDKRGRMGLDRVIRRLLADRLRWQRRRAAGRGLKGLPAEASPPEEPTTSSLRVAPP